MDTRLWSENLKGINQLEDLGVDGDNTGIDIMEIGRYVVDWMCLAEDRDQWRVRVNTEMNLQFHKSPQFLD
jgi:hypothetical protein